MIPGFIGYIFILFYILLTILKSPLNDLPSQLATPGIQVGSSRVVINNIQVHNTLYIYTGVYNIEHIQDRSIIS